MTIWFFMVILCSAAAVLIAYPLIRSYEMGLAPAQDAAVYQDQLKEVDRDLEAGTINANEAKAARAEIERRLEQAAKTATPARPLSPALKLSALIGCAIVVIVGGVGLYADLGSPQLPSAAVQQQQQQASGQPDQATQIEQIIAKIQDRVKANPNDADAWRMLGWALFNVQRFTDSVEALKKAVALAPDNTEYKSMLAESTIQAAQGTVTPAAQDLLNAVLAKDPKDIRARYYDAIGHEQSGDQQGALDRWAALLADAPPDARWRDDVRARIAALGKALNKDVSATLNAAPTPASPPALTDDQKVMINGMVAKLASELQANPKNPEGWVQLMRSYQVLQQPDQAKQALADALKAFDGDQATQDKLKAAAHTLQVGD